MQTAATLPVCRSWGHRPAGSKRQDATVADDLARPGTTLADTGEWALLDALQRRLPPDPRVVIGPGDDAAVVPTSDHVVLTVDVLVEGVHFRRDWAPAQDIGARAAAASLADVAAMGAQPTVLVVGLVAPGDVETSWVLRMADGLRDEAATANASVVGGDVSSGPLVMLSVTALGDLAGRPAVTRAGAMPGDVVALAGRLGWSAAGLAVLRRGFASPRALVGAYRRPTPPYEAGLAAAEAGATAMCDVSDGLVSDLQHVAVASGVMINVDTELIEVAEPVESLARAYGRDPWAWVLGGGEDHALVATFPSECELPRAFRRIGEVIGPADSAEPGSRQVLVDGHPWVDAERPKGHEHFR